MQKGFTLIELLVVIGIIGIMTSVGLVSINESRKSKELEIETRRVVAVIREAQNNAFSGKNADVCDYWRFRYNVDDNDRKFRIRGVGDSSCNQLIFDYEINSKNIRFAGGWTGVDFYFPNGEINPPIPEDIKLCRKDKKECLSIVVSSSGNIKIE